MKNNVSDSNRIFVDRPLVKPVATPSLWSICKDDTDYAEAALRVFLMLCLLSSLVLCGLKVAGTPVVSESADYNLTLRVWSNDSVPSASFKVSYR